MATCPTCYGKGYVAVQCWNCGGKGFFDDVPCSECKGAGELWEECQVCHHTGSVPDSAAESRPVR
jgi:DnaJ-class molecular chaperone